MVRVGVPAVPHVLALALNRPDLAPLERSFAERAVGFRVGVVADTRLDDNPCPPGVMQIDD
jgi:hypothetical protein